MVAFLQSPPVDSTVSLVELVTQGGAAVAVIVVVVIFLNSIKQERKDNAAARLEDAARASKDRERDSQERQSDRELFRSSLAHIVSGHERVMGPIVDELKELREDTVRIESKIDRLHDARKVG